LSENSAKSAIRVSFELRELGGSLTFSALITNGSYAQKYAFQTWAVTTKFLFRSQPLPNNDFMVAEVWRPSIGRHSMALPLEKG